MAFNFPTNLTIDDCEAFIENVSKSEGEGDLALPVEATHSAFGGLAAAIQAVNTWGRSSRRRHLLLGGNAGTDDEKILRIITRPHKFCAAMLAKSIEHPDGLTDVRLMINAAARSAIERQGTSQYGQQRGPLCWFAFVDHSTKGFDRNFYLQNSEAGPEPRRQEQITSIIRSMVEKSTSVAGGSKFLPDESVEHLGRIFFELFINTHEHGSRGQVRSEWLRPGLRVLYTNGINLDEAGAESALKGEKALGAYLSSKDLQVLGRRRFIELSIIDSGLGYCGRWIADHPELQHGQQLTLHDELALFKQCFNFRQTSSGNRNKGHGLPVVMDRLTKLKGFMRVRSGRLSLYRDFVAQPFLPSDPCSFFDWKSGVPAEQYLNEMAPVSGAAVTLLIPLEAKQ